MEEQNQPLQQQSTPQPEKPEKQFYKKAWFVILVIILLVGIGGVLMANQIGYLMLFRVAGVVVKSTSG